jgi:broad specificity phosphatase PhoE
MTEQPVTYRFPAGESFADVVQRLEPVLLEAEAQTAPVLLVSHLSTLRALLAYFRESDLADALRADFPQHTVVEFVSTTYGWRERVVPLLPPAAAAARQQSA